MLSFSLLPGRRIGRGRIVSSPRGLYVIIKRHQGRVVMVPIKKGPDTRHRADVHLSLYDAGLLGLDPRDFVRCVPFITEPRQVWRLGQAVPVPLMERIDKAVSKEMEMQEYEDSYSRN